MKIASIEMISFQDCTEQADRFFNLLPLDWREGIEPFWQNYIGNARIYILLDEGEIVGGGIVFRKVSPDTIIYREEAEYWLNKGFAYIGFLWFKPELRGKGYGTIWLKRLYESYPEQSYWLAIEDQSLTSFYLRNGFQLVKELHLPEWKEWLFVRAANEDHSLLSKFTK